ncbi:MAG: MTH1187 family thiamine-binding protein [Candidatus Nitrosotenuis sp.]
MVHAEISIYPVGTDSTSLSFYIAKAIEAIKGFEDIKCEITPMGTILESDEIKKIFEASSAAIEAVHRLGVKRVEAVLKIDSRTDKSQSMRQKVQSVDKHLSKGS